MAPLRDFVLLQNIRSGQACCLTVCVCVESSVKPALSVFHSFGVLGPINT